MPLPAGKPPPAHCSRNKALLLRRSTRPVINIEWLGYGLSNRDDEFEK